MAYDSMEITTDHIEIEGDIEIVINHAREEARKNQIRFGSTSSAIYHMALHGSYKKEYLAEANLQSITLTFVDKNSAQKCILIVKSNGRLILATCY